MAADDYSAEEWRDMPGHEKYEVSNLGRVRKKAQIIKPWRGANDYDYVGLGRSYRGTVHRLVCRAFHGDPPSPEHKCVAHGDGNRANNRPENLRWATYSENLADALRHGTSPLIQYRQGSLSRANHNMAKLTEDDVTQLRKLAATDMARQAIARRFGISRNQLWRILTGKNWKDAGRR